MKLVDNLHLNNRKLFSKILLLLATVFLLSACQAAAEPVSTTPAAQEASATLPAPHLKVATFTPLPPSSTPAPTSTATLTPVPSITPTSTLSPTPDPYAGLSILELAERSYGGGDLQVQGILAENSYFTRSLITYPSDGLTIYGFMDTPRQPPAGGEGARYPVIIALHGYIDPAIYGTVDYTTRYADDLARAGFLVLHPNLRGYPPSDSGPDLFRVGMAVDVLNLIGIVKEQSGQPGPLELANPGAIGVWGHSMGGGIATRVITVSPDVRAAVLYGAMSGDEKQNFERINTYFSNGTRGLEELQAPEDVFQRISPINYLDRIQAAVSINHGKDDPDVPLAWSLDLCRRLRDLGKDVECYTYPGEGHTFHGDGDTLFIQRAIAFFNERLR